jgi:putative transposase
MASTMVATLVLEALNRALEHHQVKHEQLRVHTDQESQYQATAHWQLVEGRKNSCSMSARAAAGTTPW